MFCLKLVSFLFLFSQSRSTQLDSATSPGIGCIGPNSWYFGTQSRTKSGFECQRWDTNTPHTPSHIPRDGDDHNYCRNPLDDVNGVWCYTTDPTVEWDYCDVPSCGDDSKIIWADIRNESATILAVSADPKEIRKQLSPSGELSPSVLAMDSAHDHSHSEFVGVTGSYNEQTIFFADSIAKCIVVKNMDMEMESRHLYGIAGGVRSMAYDWVRQNLYWADDVMKMIMMSDATLSYYKPVFSIKKGSLQAVALHAVEEQLFFSVRQSRRSKIYVSDLSGANARSLLDGTRLYDVTSISVDCSDNRLYFTDYLGFGSLVYSCFLNGTDVKRHYYRRATKFAGISAYKDNIFMTDATGRKNRNGEKVHALWLKKKYTWRAFRFSFKGDPRGMKVLSEKEEDFANLGFHSGDCLSMPPCDHICLSRKGATRECACAMGYKKVGDTGCKIKTPSDEYLLMADDDERKLYQIPFSGADDISLLPLEYSGKISSLSIDALTGSFYVAGEDKSIKKFSLTGEASATYDLPDGSIVKNVAVDPLTGNVYYSDDHSQSIYVKNSNGVVTREIMTSNEVFTSDIKTVALDLRNKKVYWTNTNSLEGSGQVLRMNMDGSGVEVVLSDLQWPKGITIDYDRDSIFISEARQYLVHEIPLDWSENTTITSHEFKFRLPRTKSHDFIDVTDITFNDEFIYLLDDHQVLKADLTSGKLSEFSEPQFYHPVSILAYSSSRMQRHIGTFSNPCTTLTECDTMCLPTSQETAICV